MKFFSYFSEILDYKVYDSRDRIIGRVYDIAMAVTEEIFPRSIQIIVSRGFLSGVFAVVPVEAVNSYDKEVRLKVKLDEIVFEKEPPRLEFSLRRDILDQQVVDTDGHKVVRVNDVHLLQVDNVLYLAHVDVGTKGLIRRLGWSAFFNWAVKTIMPDTNYLKEEKLISWKNAHPVHIGLKRNLLQTDIARKKLSRIPVAELADIMEDLDILEKLSLFKTFTVDMQRVVFADMTLQEKEDLIDRLDEKEAGSLLENIPADEAADLLHDLSKDKVDNLMRFMHTNNSRKLYKLLGFSQDTAGGLMTTEYLSLPKDALVKHAWEKIKENADVRKFTGNINSIYLVDENYQLSGMTSLNRFVNAGPDELLINTCLEKNVFVRTDDTIEEVALLIEKYKFVSIPVLDDKGILQGVITNDDVLEEMISIAWKKYKDQI
ncbi:MAG: magnesium transporter [Candidatus Omnitrophica bacterium]|nr:magnesium transporter [Candidatus Omnitrophota bacterium]